MQFFLEPPLPAEFSAITFNEEQLSDWLLSVINREAFEPSDSINFIFCSDAYLHQINLEYLNHDTLTDIITFDNSEEPKTVEGDIFISLERIKENAEVFDVPFEQELKRVLVHGMLHLIGYNDKTEEEQKTMREKEDFYIGQFQ